MNQPQTNCAARQGQDVAIVGLGCLIAQGRGVAGLDEVLAGKSALIAWPGKPDCLVAQCDQIDRTEGDPALYLALAAARDALLNAAGDPSSRCETEQEQTRFLQQWLPHIARPGRIATVFSLSKGAVHAAAQDAAGHHLTTHSWLDYDPAVGARAIAAEMALSGPCYAPAAACATGGHVLAAARGMLLDNRADMVICGAADASLHPLILWSYRRLGLLAQPEATELRCFSGTHSGFAVGEGAAAFIMMRVHDAQRLGLTIQARICEILTGSLACDLLAMPDDGRTLARHISLALRRACLDPAHVDLISVHGTGTAEGDNNEARALAAVFGQKKLAALPLLGSKHLHGHLLGAAAIVETALAVRLFQRRGAVAVTARLGQGRASGVSHIEGLTARWQAALLEPRTVLKLTAGFGGHVSALLLASAD